MAFRRPSFPDLSATEKALPSKNLCTMHNNLSTRCNLDFSDGSDHFPMRFFLVFITPRRARQGVFQETMAATVLARSMAEQEEKSGRRIDESRQRRRCAAHDRSREDGKQPQKPFPTDGRHTGRVVACRRLLFPGPGRLPVNHSLTETAAWANQHHPPDGGHFCETRKRGKVSIGPSRVMSLR